MTRFNFNAVSAAVVALVALAGHGDPAAAQESAQTFRACLVPQVGAMYLIGLEGLPAECFSGEHREISWTEGGSPNDATVDTDALQDASVTTAKIAPGAVTTTQISPSAITTAEIADRTIQASDIALRAITGAQVANESLGGNKLTRNSVDGRALDLRIETELATFDVRRRLSPDFPTFEFLRVECPAGKDLLTGGFEVIGVVEGLTVNGSRPSLSVSGSDLWFVSVVNSGTEDGQVRVFAVCADLR